MSHIINKINANTADKNGQIDVPLTDIITINSPQDGEYLAKKASDWGTKAISSDATSGGYGMKPLGTYSVGSYPYTTGDNYIVYDFKQSYRDANIGDYSATAQTSPVSNANWWQSLTFGSYFNGKTMIFEANIAPQAGSSSTAFYATAQWVNGFALTGYTPIGPPVIIHGQGHADTCWGRFESDGTFTYISLKLTYINSTSYLSLSGGYRHQAENYAVRIYD